MNRRLAISILFGLVVLVIAGYIYRSTFRPPVAATRIADTTLDDQIEPKQTASQDASEFDELVELINETIVPEEWIAVDSSTMVLKEHRLLETVADEAEYVLTLELFRGESLLATQMRYFANHRGPHTEVAVPRAEYLACAMYANGFLSGTSEVSGKSDKDVAIKLDWMFDDQGTNLKSTFQCDFDASVANSGTIDCQDGARLCWKLEKKSPVQGEERMPR